jgi:hypothetical protein
MTIISLILAFLSGVAGGLLLCFHLVDQAFVLLIKGRAFRTIVTATDRQEDYFQKIRQFERSVMEAIENGVVSNPCVYGSRALMIKETREDGEAKS